MNYEAKNIFYISNFNDIGGTETFIWEMGKMFEDWDIMVIYKTGSLQQIQRLKKFFRVVKYNEVDTYKCEKAFFNYDLDIIDSIEAKEYGQIIHALWKTQGFHPKLHPKINKYFAVSESASDEFFELYGIRPEVLRNPLTITVEEKEPVLWLISATRLTPEKRKRQNDSTSSRDGRSGN